MLITMEMVKGEILILQLIMEGSFIQMIISFLKMESVSQLIILAFSDNKFHVRQVKNQQHFIIKVMAVEEIHMFLKIMGV